MYAIRSYYVTEKYISENNLEELPSDVKKEFKNYYHDLMKELVRGAILYNKHRVDGRSVITSYSIHYTKLYEW